VLDASGRLIYGIRRPAEDAAWAPITPNAPDTYTDWTPVDRVLNGFKDTNGDKFAAIINAGDGGALYSTGPIRGSDGRLLGVVLVGTNLHPLLASIKRDALSDITLYDDAGNTVASTFSREGQTDPDALSAKPSGRNQIDSGGTVRETKSLYGRDYDFLYGRLFVRGDTGYRYSIALPSSFIATAASVTRWQMTALFAGATAAVLLVGWVIARSLTTPLLKLAHTAEAVSEGDLTARSGVVSGDEIGTLAMTFDSMTNRLQHQHLSTIKALASAIDARDPYTLGHSMRVGQLAARIGESLGLSSLALQHLEVGGYLHDIGKIGIRDSVLLKEGSLTQDERCRIEEHPLIGLRILESIELPDAVLDIVGAHHEKLDGSGYPLHLRDEELSIFARVGAVADIYDALVTERLYKPALSLDQVLDMLSRESRQGRLDAEVVRALENVAPEWEVERLAQRSLLDASSLWRPLAAAS
jgi:putative nucleotidyltransferase with HDIG domain